MRDRRFGLFVAIGILTGLTLMPVAASAAQQTAEPAVLTTGWWWEDYQGETIDIQGNKVILETPNTFCPQTPGSTGAVPGACAEGRLPIEIRGGDYETPVMLSAVGFDLSMLTPGSKVSKFTVSFLEAEAGCYDQDKDGDINPSEAGGDHCEQTDPINVEGHELQACLLPQIFGDAEGRPYDEVPTYECSGSDPIAKRKEIKAVDEGDTDDIDHMWTFDLTDFAKGWAEEFSVATNIMIVGKKPKETNGQDSWRVVLAGPKAQRGIVTKLVFEPGEIEVAPIAPPTGGTGSSSGFTSTGTGSTTTDFGSGSTDLGSGSTTPGTSSDTTDPAGSPSPAPAGDALASEVAGTEEMPGYVWLALLAGLVGFILVRQAVIENTTGIRPDGVLAKIHALNAERRGVVEEAVAPAGGLSQVLGSARSKISELTGKLPFGRKG